MPRLKKITKISSDWNSLKGIIKVKFTEHSGWYQFGGVKENMFVLVDSKGEEFRSNQIYVHA